jgi:hypothetical protein
MSNTGSSNSLPTVQGEHRQFPRAHVKWHAIILSPGININVSVIEISDIGFGFIGDVAYKIGSRLSFQSDVPDPVNGHVWHAVSGQADVMNCVLTRDGFRTGVTIQSIDPAYQELLKAWVKLRLRE